MRPRTAYASRPTTITSVCRKSRALLIRKPRPALAFTCSATTSASHATPSDCRRPTRAPGSAPGSRMWRTRSAASAGPWRRRRTDRGRCRGAPPTRLRYSGIITPSATSAIFDVSPIPNQRMNSGTSPNSGSVRIICIGGSTSASPARLVPASEPSPTAMATPRSSPSVARRSDTSRAWGRSPDFVRSQAVERISVGAASVFGERSPLALASCQTTSRRSGLIQRAARERSARVAKPGRVVPCGTTAAAKVWELTR